MNRTMSLTRSTTRLLLVQSLFLFTAAVPRDAIAASAHARSGLVRIAIVGDSTVADYKLDDTHRGWGQLFPEFIDTNRVSVQNFAVNGRSTKTFKSEGRWELVLAFKPDYIFIQFGHNDSHAKDRPESTDPETDYSRYLREYVESARAQGATPILVTPMHRGTWDTDGGHLTQELLPYADAMGRVAKEKKVPVIDLYTLSAKTFEQLGSEQLKTLFAFPDTDKTHFNEKGARLLATLVARETARRVPTLKSYLMV
jgi:lysophospholipase L1-like esterase